MPFDSNKFSKQLRKAAGAKIKSATPNRILERCRLQIQEMLLENDPKLRESPENSVRFAVDLEDWLKQGLDIDTGKLLRLLQVEFPNYDIAMNRSENQVDYKFSRRSDAPQKPR